MEVLQGEISQRYGVMLTEEYLEKATKSGVAASKAVYADVLNSNMVDITLPGMLPRDAASQPSSEMPSDALVQIQSVRDVTQPLRPHADMDENDAVWGAANRKNTDKRLLKLVVTDGHVTVPAVELQTLKTFRKIPLPGEKILIKRGCAIVNGMLIMEEDSVVLVGGEVELLKQEFLMHRGAIRPSQGGADTGAPQFEPFSASQGHARPKLTAPLPAAGTGGPPQQKHLQDRVERGGRGNDRDRGGGDRGRRDNDRGGRGSDRGGFHGGDRGGRGGDRGGRGGDRGGHHHGGDRGGRGNDRSRGGGRGGRGNDHGDRGSRGGSGGSRGGARQVHDELDGLDIDHALKASLREMDLESRREIINDILRDQAPHGKAPAAGGGMPPSYADPTPAPKKAPPKKKYEEDFPSLLGADW